MTDNSVFTVDSLAILESEAETLYRKHLLDPSDINNNEEWVKVAIQVECLKLLLSPREPHRPYPLLQVLLPVDADE